MQIRTLVNALRAVPLLGRATGVVGQRPVGGWSEVSLGGCVEGHLWPARRRRTGPPIVLAVGVTPQGPADPRVQRLADALARVGRTVLVPRLALSERRLTDDDVTRLLDAVVAMDGGRGVAVLGFSFGGSYSLVAAADPRAAGRLRAVATFGAYAELSTFLRVARRRLSDAERLLASLELPDEEHRRVVAVLEGRADLGELPDRLLALVRRLSPATYAGAVHVPVFLLHARGDPTVPDHELATLARAFPHALCHTVESFTHVDLVRDGGHLPTLLADLVTVWRFTVGVLDA